MKQSNTLFFLLFSFPSFCGISLCSILFFNCENTKQDNIDANTFYNITGHISDPGENAQVVLSLFDPVTQNKTPLDTSAIGADNSYQLKFEFIEPDLFRVDFPGRKYVMLAIDKGQQNIELNLTGENNADVEIKGSPDSEILLAYDEFRSESNTRLIKPTYAAMRAAGKTNSNPKEEIIAVEAYVKASSEHRKELIDFTKKSIGTSIALYGTVLRWTGDEEAARLEKLVTNFKVVHPDLKMTKIMEDKVARYKKVALGAKTPAIAEKDTSGVIIKLHDVKGKVTLIDFWASWCGPCLRQVPDLMEAYNLFHKKGFEIYGVSVDSKENRWKAAIGKYKMPWPNVSDLKGWGAKPAAAYNVTFIPFNVLIDGEGNIISKNLHSKELQGKLAELLD